MLVPCFHMRDLSDKSLFYTLPVLKTSLSSAAYSPSPAEFTSSHQYWKKVGGCVLPACFPPSHWLPVDVETHKHLSLLVLPLGWSVRVVAVFLYPLLQGAVDAKLSLKKQRVSTQSTVNILHMFKRYCTVAVYIHFHWMWSRLKLAQQL